MHGGKWYSFPAAGENTEWSQGTAADGTCAPKQISARCLFSLVAQKMGHPAGCASASAQECAQFMAGASKDLEISAWHEAFWHGACSPVSQDDLQGEAVPESDATKWQALGVDETNMRWGFWRDLAPGITTIVNSTSIVVV